MHSKFVIHLIFNNQHTCKFVCVCGGGGAQYTFFLNKKVYELHKIKGNGFEHNLDMLVIIY